MAKAHARPNETEKLTKARQANHIHIDCMTTKNYSKKIRAYVTTHGQTTAWCPYGRTMGEDVTFYDRLFSVYVEKGDAHCMKSKDYCKIDMSSPENSGEPYVWPEPSMLLKNGSAELKCEGGRTFKIVPKD